MIINRENYEAFLLDLMEGNLSEDQENILRHFLEENPDLTVEDTHPDIRLPESREIKGSVSSFPLKEELKKGGVNSEINAGNYEQFCIARMEGDLSDQAESRLDIFLSENPGLDKSAKTFGLTILKADRSVVFPEKNILRKGKIATVTLKDYINRRFIYKAVSIAASITILISVFNFLSDNFVPDQVLNQDNHIVNITEDQTTAPESDRVPVSDSSPELTSNDHDGVAGREFSARTHVESVKPFSGVSLQSVTGEKEPDINHQFVSREPVLLPVKIISTVEVKTIPTDFSPAIVRPVHFAFKHREQQSTENERSGAGMILNGLLAFATRNVDGNEDSGGLNLWNIADAGFRGINTLTGAELHLEREFNQEGELVSMAFSSRVLEFRRTSSQKEN